MNILQIGHSSLAASCESIDLNNLKAYTNVFNKLAMAFRKIPCYGIAAPQLGMEVRAFIAQGPDNPTPVIYINPTLEYIGDEMESSNEGCLSVRNFEFEIERYRKVKLNAFDKKGNPIEHKADGLQARIFQHEVDHLDGVLLLKHASTAQLGAFHAIKKLDNAEKLLK